MNTHAVVEIGSMQFDVSKNDIIEVNRLGQKVGHEIKLNSCLMATNGKEIEFGRPYLKNVTVFAEIIGHKRAPKVLAFKYRKRKSSKFRKGHRQDLTVLKVKEIEMK